MKTKLILILLLLTGFNQVITLGQQDTILKHEFINVATLIVNFESYKFEGGTISYFNKCTECSNDSLPFSIDFKEPGDFGSILFKISSTSDTVFFGTVIWHGHGQIYNPTGFTTEYPFAYLMDTVDSPDTIEYFNYNGLKFSDSDQWLKPKADSAWDAVSSLKITNLFQENSYKAGIFLYAPAVGLFNSKIAKWIVFLYYNDINYLSTDMKTPDKTIIAYPNPCNNLINIDFLSNNAKPYELKIIDLNGKIIMNYLNTSPEIDISNLKAGVYILKISNIENSFIRLIVKK